MLPLALEAEVDFSRLRKERYEKVQAAMVTHGVDALVLTRPYNSLYATGTRHQGGMYGFGLYYPIVAVVPRGGQPWIFTTDLEGVAPEVPPNQTLGPLFGEFDSAAKYLGRWLKEILGLVARGRIGFDAWTGALHEILPKELPGAQFVNGEAVMWDAKKTKTDDEKKLLRLAEAVDEAALYAALEHLKPGVSEMELVKAFQQRVMELGHKATFIPVFTGEPRSRAEMPYRKIPLDRRISEGELLYIDCGIDVHGYSADLGRTWYCGDYTKPGPKHKDLFKVWREVVDKMLENCKPGKTAADIHRAAGDNISSYCGHSIGVGSPDGFVIGGMSISWEEEEQWVVEPGMCLLIEPIIVREGVGSYRAEEHVFITDTGYEPITTFPYGPLGEA
jgi:Xaa-Pro aminopeptidase